ncbi:MAG TPA: zf-HC2 domain-containing protein [Afifellaceae bacterium]|nr:zf-HC2 domain-containing protein [Afifellaceae bacterium]
MSRPLDCEEVITQLFDYLNRELDPETLAAIEEHIRLCRGCFSRAEFERRLRARLAQAGEAEAPESLRRRTRRIIERF